MPVLDGLEFTKRFRIWEEEQQRVLEAQGFFSPPSLSSLHISRLTFTSQHQSSIQQCIPPLTRYDGETSVGLPRRDRFLVVGMSANCDEQTKYEVIIQHNHSCGTSFFVAHHRLWYILFS